MGEPSGRTGDAYGINRKEDEEVTGDLSEGSEESTDNGESEKGEQSEQRGTGGRAMSMKLI